jgi:hypothetical protein
MTPLELKALIESDATATTLLNTGSDVACALRCSEIAPKLLKTMQLSKLGVFALYSASPQDGLTILATIEAVAQENPAIATVLAFMQPGVAAECLPDFGLPAIRATLTAATNVGGLGLSEALASPLLRAAEVPQTITPQQVEYVRTRT